MKHIDRSEIAKRAATKCGLSKYSLEPAITSIFEVIIDMLNINRAILVPGLGKLSAPDPSQMTKAGSCFQSQPVPCQGKPIHFHNYADGHTVSHQ